MVFCRVSGEISQHNQEETEEINVFLYTRHDVKSLLNKKDEFFGAKAWFIMKQFVEVGTIV
jgi:hypothetical protein